MQPKYLLFVLILVLGLSCSKGDSNFSGDAGAGGSIARMTISGNYLYIVSNTSLYTYDITHPQTTVLISEQPISWGDIETIFPYRDKLFIGSQSGMYVFDNSDPKKPKLQGRAQHLRACDPVVADDNFAYVTLRNNNIGCGGTVNQLQVYDISGTHVLTPKITGTLDMPEPYGLGYSGNTLYVCMGAKGLNIVNTTDKAKPVSLKILTGEHFIDVIPYNDLLIAYVEGGIALYDISSPADPQKLSTIQN
ncbi:hypothetical protein U0035_08610 [Niabella yanshanensis]|uniref:LVIVD repeat-containing protein n=1 Tax=Niabella yanshanensis TaxID=577386 RepID=A0ABZ0WBW4_9BACT|nr:hypothetical protein [Niabella yanshanensis]WQD40204.1 hypothetical protein U0035_08610 [Niabella yanshanensis]